MSYLSLILLPISQLRNNSSLTPKVFLAKWSIVMEVLARGVWREYVAERMAYQFYNETIIHAHIFLFEPMLQGTIERIDIEFKRYSGPSDLGCLTDYVVRQMSMLLNQLGRSLGLLHFARDKDTDIEDAFFNRINHIDHRWTTPIRMLVQELQIATENSYKIDMMNGITQVVIKLIDLSRPY